jgi:3-oxoacyl-[acyl-carrier-protein] synthase II
MADQSSQSIAVVGTGLVSPLGIGVATNVDAMLAGTVGKRPINRFDVSAFGQQSGGIISDADETALRQRFDDDDLAYCMIKAAGEEAMGPSHPPSPNPRLGLVLATNFGAMETLEWCWRERIDTGDMDEDTFLTQQDVVNRIAEWCGAAGPSVQLSLSCASGAAAVTVGCQWIRAGRADRVLTVCYDSLSEFCWTGLSNLRTITDDCVRPFDIRRRGTVFSEGAAAVLLAKEADSPRAWVLGCATNNNAFHMTAPSKEAEGSRQVMSAALADAGLAAAEIDLVSAHATGTQANDVTESQALNNLGITAPVGAFKSALGHLLGAAGAAEIIVGIEAMHRGVVPQVLNHAEPDPACAVDFAAGAPRQGSFATLLTNSAGIGGNNSATVLGLRLATDSAAPMNRSSHLHRAGWVLPGNVGGGETLPGVAADELLQVADGFAEFSVKPYVQSVKGYLDPAAAYSLAAARLCLEDDGAVPEDMSDFAIVAATQYGAPQSGYKFFQMLIEKGHRLASPMVFPHSYPNTAANLIAIEYGAAGPHMVLTTCDDAGGALDYGDLLIQTGTAENVLVLLSEAAESAHVPNGTAVLNGAVCLWLKAGDGRPLPAATAVTRHGTVCSLLN